MKIDNIQEHQLSTNGGGGGYIAYQVGNVRIEEPEQSITLQDTTQPQYSLSLVINDQLVPITDLTQLTQEQRDMLEQCGIHIEPTERKDTL